MKRIFELLFFKKRCKTYKIFLDDYYFEEMENNYSFLKNSLLAAIEKNHGRFRKKA